MSAILAPPQSTDRLKKRLPARRKATPTAKIKAAQLQLPPIHIPIVDDEDLPERQDADQWRNGLATFPWEDGFRLVTDPVTGQTTEVPLTLFDMLYECEDDIGAVFMTQGPNHAFVTRLVAVTLQAYLGAAGWLILNDVYIRWGFPGYRPKGPDIAAMPGGRMPSAHNNSYVIGRDGPLPSFIIEVTSKSTRDADLIAKRDFYASLGVKEYLIIDLLPKTGKDWQLIGYRLLGAPTYTTLTPDEDGSVNFETVGLRFKTIADARVEIYDSATGERLLDPDELKAQARVETMRAKIEAEARAEAEALAEQERVRAEQERTRAEQEHAFRLKTEEKLAKTLAQLRSLGIEPE